MGYFSNGEEGDRYEATHCQRCAHGGYVGMCPVLQLHLAWQDDAYGKNGDKSKRWALEQFIPRADIHNERCKMFHEKSNSGK